MRCSGRASIAAICGAAVAARQSTSHAVFPPCGRRRARTQLQYRQVVLYPYKNIPRERLCVGFVLVWLPRSPLGAPQGRQAALAARGRAVGRGTNGSIPPPAFSTRAGAPWGSHSAAQPNTNGGRRRCRVLPGAGRVAGLGRRLRHRVCLAPREHANRERGASGAFSRRVGGERSALFYGFRAANPERNGRRNAKRTPAPRKARPSDQPNWAQNQIKRVRRHVKQLKVSI